MNIVAFTRDYAKTTNKTNTFRVRAYLQLMTMMPTMKRNAAMDSPA